MESGRERDKKNLPPIPNPSRFDTTPSFFRARSQVRLQIPTFAPEEDTPAASVGARRGNHVSMVD
jgi:hypothetical protein